MEEVKTQLLLVDLVVDPKKLTICFADTSNCGEHGHAYFKRAFIRALAGLVLHFVVSYRRKPTTCAFAHCL